MQKKKNGFGLKLIVINIKLTTIGFVRCNINFIPLRSGFLLFFGIVLQLN